MRYAVVVAFVIGIAACARAQVDGVPRDLIEQRIEAAAEQLGGEADLSNLFEILTDRYLDPIDLNLYFERFINPKRSSPPDFDID